MKLLPLIIGVCLLSCVTDCHSGTKRQALRLAPGQGRFHAQAEENMIRSKAVTALAAWYPNLDTADLALVFINHETPPVGKPFISVIYKLPAPAQTNFYNTPEGRRVKITTRGFGVTMSLTKEVLNVSEFALEDIGKVDVWPH